MRKKTVTMKDIARQVGVSVNAVSLALNNRAGVGDETRKEILNLAEKMGYLEQSSKYIQIYSSKNICVLLEYRFFRDFQFYGRVLLGIEEEAKKSGYNVFINSFETEEVPDCVQKGKVSGVIVVGKIESSFLRKLKKYPIPIIVADYVSMDELTDSVVSDNEFGAYKMASYLIGHGYKKIGYFGDIEYSPSTRDRFLGYVEAMHRHFKLGNFEDSLKYVKQFSMLADVEEYVIKRDAKSVFQLFKSIEQKPEVLICSNDELAILLLKTLQNYGYLIPEDIGIVGFDDIELGKMVIPALTTVHVQKKLMGKKVTQRLLYRMNHPKEHVEKIVMDVDIVERDSIVKGMK